MNIITEIDAQIAELQKKKKAIQDKCSHPINESLYHPDEDEYGTTIGPGSYTNRCLLCDARWSSTRKPE